MTEQLYSLRDFAQSIGVSEHRIVYAPIGGRLVGNRTVDLCQRRYSASGSGHRFEMATTKPLPQPPMSLQTWTITLGPSPSGTVASPVVEWSGMEQS